MTTLFYYEYSSFYLESTYKIAASKTTGEVKKVELMFKSTPQEAAVLRAAVDSRCEGIYAKITPDMTEYDIVKLFHDELIRSVRYDKGSEYGESVYGALVEGVASCQGYSKAFAYLCDGYGIPNIIVTGEASGPHMWNMVMLGDSWYHLDITNDDPGNTQYSNHVKYKYFLINDGRLSETHTVDVQPFAYPAAQSETPDYFRLNGIYAESYSQAVGIAYNELLRAAGTGADGVELRCSDDAVFAEVYEKFFKKAELLDIVEVVNKSAVRRFNVAAIAYSAENDGTNVIEIYLTYE